LLQQAETGAEGHPISGRHEFKYLIRQERTLEIARFVGSHLELDKYSQGLPRNRYTVRSIYYDSPGFRCYYEKANGDQNRRKFRIRSYNQPGGAAVFLECKQRKGSTYTKRKSQLDVRQLEILQAREGLDGHVIEPSGVYEQLLLSIDRWDYQPTSLVVYDREAYVAHGQEDTVRVTFDNNLRARIFPELDELHDEADLEDLLYGWTILEVKFTDIVPRFLKQLVSRFSLQRQACSKYGVSVALLLSETPTKKEGWNHVYVR
jgi:hypothetical protein